MAKAQKKSGKKEETFEEAMKQMEEIVQRLESGDLPLEDSLKLYEDGVRLTRVCSSRLQTAEKRIEVLMKNEQDEVVSEPLETDLFQQKTDNAQGEGETG